MQTSPYKCIRKGEKEKMKRRKFLFVSHAYMAKGTKSSLELIMGEQKCVECLCAYVEEHFDIKEEIKKRLDILSPEDELIIVTDLFGGSVNNEFMSIITQNTNVYLIAGLNLALCINLIIRKYDECASEVLIRECLDEAKSSLIFCNDLIETKQDEEDEEF